MLNLSLFFRLLSNCQLRKGRTKERARCNLLATFVSTYIMNHFGLKEYKEKGKKWDENRNEIKPKLIKFIT